MATDHCLTELLLPFDESADDKGSGGSHSNTNGIGSDDAGDGDVRQLQQHWWIIVRVCVVGFLVNCQPSEPYLTRYLKEDKHLTDQQLDDRVWPVDTYGAFALLLPVALLADTAGYRATILVGLLCRQLTRVILLFLHGVRWMAIMQVTYAAATGINAIYFAFVYVVVPEKAYPIATVCVHASFHLGNALGSGLAQLLVTHTSVRHNLSVLFYLSWAFSSAGLLWFLVLFPKSPQPSQNVDLPSPQAEAVMGTDGNESSNAIVKATVEATSAAVASTTSTAISASGAITKTTVAAGLPRPSSDLYVDSPSSSLISLCRTHGWITTGTYLCSMYADNAVMRWSLWWLFGYGAAYIVSNYYQNQFYDIDPSGDFGAVAVVMEVAAAVGPALLRVRRLPFTLRSCMCVARPCMCVGWDVNGATYALVAAAGSSLVIGSLYVSSVRVQSSIFASYLFNTAAVGVASYQYAAATNAIAANCRARGRHGILFALNTFSALAIITVAQAVCASKDAAVATFYYVAAALDFAVVPALACAAALVAANVCRRAGQAGR